ncbi:HAMP domain-containing protein [Nocardia panacis]|uniref:histidine kinase n=1 Tax=Nocardia panacis TaxID=2340916 RepID=A0A3A4KYH8_9NOCA|nr:HAMP domain-containing protein [Nocardia panacis]
MPLRVTLVLILVFTSALGLLISGIAVTSVFEKSLLRQTDDQLRRAAYSWARPDRLTQAPPLPPPEARHAPSPFYIVATRHGDPQKLVLRPYSVDAAPKLPDPPADQPKTVDSQGSSSIHWRVVTLFTPDGSTTVAMPLTQNDEVLRGLVALELIVGAVVLILLGAASYFIVRRSLRPLREVEKTAAAIAAGDLHRRVPVRGTKTEVDRLSTSLNGMLTQIQQAFAATEASEEAAVRSEAKMRRFVADASHELRTPLTTIRGFAELYRQGVTADPAMFMDRIEREAQRMGLLVEDLLMLARLDAQRPLDLREVDLLGLASDAVHNARAVAAAARPEGPRRPIQLEIRPGEGTLEVLGDAERLRQVLSNLLNNALTHTPPEAAVTVRLTPAADHVLLEVADTGPGLPEDAAERVFERFYRTDASRTRSSGGTGLGLSIVQALVTAHGGTVRVASEPGAGTTFTVRLPRGTA